jgi:hypothetical protein
MARVSSRWISQAQRPWQLLVMLKSPATPTGPPTPLLTVRLYEPEAELGLAAEMVTELPSTHS